MKIGVISDTHGKHYYMENIIEKLGNVDLLIHLGDLCSDAEKLSADLGIPLKCVRGNCDFTRTFTDQQIIVVDNIRIFITHGHNYYVKNTLDRIIYKGLESDVDIVLFGHTHIPKVFYENDVLFMNPGSASTPYNSKYATVGIIHILEDKILPYIVRLN